MKHIKPLHRGNLNKEDKIIQKVAANVSLHANQHVKLQVVANQVCTQK